MRLLGKLVDNARLDSYATKMRRKRFALFRKLLETMPRPVSILDVGGTQGFWEVMGFVDAPDVYITLCNVQAQDVRHERFTAIAADATDLCGISDNQFDVAFSNSAIEHVGDFERQRRMAQEIQRVGTRYFVQTPNYYFPIEPHFLFPGWQWMPLDVRALLLSRFSLGWHRRIPDRDRARAEVAQVRLLRERELLELFPCATVYRERFLGMTKSLVVYGGW